MTKSLMAYFIRFFTIGLVTLDAQGNFTLNTTGATAASMPLFGGATTPIGATRTLSIADHGKTFLGANTAVTLTIAQDTLPANFKAHFIQGGTGAITFTAGSGTAMLAVSSAVKTNGAGSKATLEATSSRNAFVLSGNVIP